MGVHLMRTQSAAVYAGLKSAARRLLRAFGNQDAAAMETRVRQQELSIYCNPSAEFAERHMPIDVVIDLEAAIGLPLVTQELCRLNNGLFVPLPHAIGDAELSAATGATAKEAGDVLVGLGAAMADGHLDNGEISSVQKDISEAHVALAQLSLLLARRADQNGGGHA